MKTILALALLALPARADWSPFRGLSLLRFETVLHAVPLGSDEVSKSYSEDDAPALALSGDGDGRVLIEFSAGDETRQFHFPQLRYDPDAKTISREGVVIGRLGSWLWKFEPGWRFDYAIHPKKGGKFWLSVFLRKE